MIYFNGTYIQSDEFRLHPDDRGLLLGDGIFETLRVYHGRVFCLQAHFKRLSHGAGVLHIPLHLTIMELERVISKLLEKNGLANNNAAIRITLTRGHGLRGLLPSPHLQPTLMITATALTVQQPTPLKLHISNTTRRNDQSPLSQIKSLCYLDNILAKMEAVEHHADDAILLNTKGHIASASAANIFLVTDNGVLVTPAIKEGILPGITRQTIIDIGKEQKIPLMEKFVSIEEIEKAKEVFISNSIIEIQPVYSINHHVINNGVIGVITIKLQNALQKKINATAR